MAFKSVRRHFEQSNSLSSDEKALLGKKSSFQDVEKTVSDAFTKYEAKSEASKTRKWLLKASESICHCGQVLDVFVHHHPEYISLAWGLMKVMFIVSRLSLHAEPDISPSYNRAWSITARHSNCYQNRFSRCRSVFHVSSIYPPCIRPRT